MDRIELAKQLAELAVAAEVANADGLPLAMTPDVVDLLRKAEAKLRLDAALIGR